MTSECDDVRPGFRLALRIVHATLPKAVALQSKSMDPIYFYLQVTTVWLLALRLRCHSTATPSYFATAQGRDTSRHVEDTGSSVILFL